MRAKNRDDVNPFDGEKKLNDQTVKVEDQGESVSEGSDFDSDDDDERSESEIMALRKIPRMTMKTRTTATRMSSDGDSDESESDESEEEEEEDEMEFMLERKTTRRKTLNSVRTESFLFDFFLCTPFSFFVMYSHLSLIHSQLRVHILTAYVWPTDAGHCA